jgi:hypothetical protein
MGHTQFDFPRAEKGEIEQELTPWIEPARYVTCTLLTECEQGL